MLCFVDYRTTPVEKLALSNLNLEIISIPKSDLVYEAIDGHVDIQLNILNSKKIIIHRDMYPNLINKLVNSNIEVVKTQNSLASEYPSNILLNAFITDEYFVHNLKYTDKSLLDSVGNRKIINVKQGYTKCSILPISKKAIITNDLGIAKALSTEDFDVLHIPYGDIVLPNLNYGFIGGVGGKIDENTIAFFGTLDKYQYGDKVKDFLYKYDVTPIYLSNTKLVDRGSLFVL